jgi:hypothetical protein
MQSLLLSIKNYKKFYLFFGATFFLYIFLAFLRLQEVKLPVFSYLMGYYSYRYYLIGFIYCALLLLFYFAYRNIRKITINQIFIGYFLFCIVLLLTPLMNSVDLYHSIFSARIATIYKENAYVVAPSSFPNDPLSAYTSWQTIPQQNGPLFHLLSVLLVKVSATNTTLNLFLFKMVNFVFYSLTILFIYKLINHLNKKFNKNAIFLMAWNPLCLIEFINNGHNDIVMIFIGVIGCYFLFTKKQSLSIFFLLLSGLVKYMFWLPLLFFFKKIVQKNIKLSILIYSFILCVLLVFFLFCICSSSFSSNGLFVQLLLPQSHYSSPVFFIGNLLGIKFDYMQHCAIVAVGLLIFGLFYFNRLIESDDIATFSIHIFLALYILVMPHLHPWYLMWMMPFFIIKGLDKPIFFWCSLGLLSYVFFESIALTFLIFTVIYLIYKDLRSDLLPVYRIPLSRLIGIK